MVRCGYVRLLSSSFERRPFEGFGSSFVQHEPPSWAQSRNPIPLPVLTSSEWSSAKKHRMGMGGGDFAEGDVLPGDDL